MTKAIPVTVLTGFLGSGKTTVLAQLLKNPKLEKTAIIVNEFGEVGLDHDLLERSDEDLILLANGCVCCTVRGDLIGAFQKLEAQRLANTGRAFDRVIIETTGLADPAPILHTMMSDAFVTGHYRLEQVITTLDAVNAMTTLDQHQEAVKQAAVADRILLTKTDLVAEPLLGELRTRISALNPAAPVIAAVNGEVNVEDFFGSSAFDPAEKTTQVQDWLRIEAYEPHAHHGHEHHGHGDLHHHEDDEVDRNRHDDHISAYSIIREQPVSWAGFSAWLDMISKLRGDDLLRVKGIVNVIQHPDRPVVIHGVQHVFHQPVFLERWPNDDHRTRLVFITRDIDREDIDATLQVFENRRPRPAISTN
ncbi:MULTISPECIES: CobW family GTP-binding protein [Polaromonas]|uniref:CobW family GTP-binding protein n=1 Tax=Polaromonas aquatica TaxID=332657 RepID=A0ABW1U1K0_9BURK